MLLLFAMNFKIYSQIKKNYEKKIKYVFISIIKTTYLFCIEREMNL